MVCLNVSLNHTLSRHRRGRPSRAEGFPYTALPRRSFWRRRGLKRLPEGEHARGTRKFCYKKCDVYICTGYILLTSLPTSQGVYCLPRGHKRSRQSGQRPRYKQRNKKKTQRCMKSESRAKGQKLGETDSAFTVYLEYRKKCCV